MTEDDHAAIHGTIARYYGERLATHGPTARGVDWRDQHSQHLRHRQFDRLFGADRALSVADLGCGYGDYLGYLRSTGHRGHYTGYDVVEEMIGAAERLHGTGPDRAWRLGGVPAAPADVVVASGIFNVKQAIGTDDWERYIEATVRSMAASSGIGFGFNVLTAWSDADKRRPDLYYADPSRWFDFCGRQFGRHIAVLQDYGLYEFTLLCRIS